MHFGTKIRVKKISRVVVLESKEFVVFCFERLELISLKRYGTGGGGFQGYIKDGDEYELYILGVVEWL